MTMTAWENRAKHMQLCIVCHHTFHLLVATVIGIQLLHHLHSELYVYAYAVCDDIFHNAPLLIYGDAVVYPRKSSNPLTPTSTLSTD